MNEKIGLKQKIKKGEISPTEAIEIVLKSEGHSPKFVDWVRRTGQHRYRDAVSKKSKKKD